MTKKRKTDVSRGVGKILNSRNISPESFDRAEKILEKKMKDSNYSTKSIWEYFSLGVKN